MRLLGKLYGAGLAKVPFRLNYCLGLKRVSRVWECSRKSLDSPLFFRYIVFINPLWANYPVNSRGHCMPNAGYRLRYREELDSIPLYSLWGSKKLN
jgi:hypothetical protein